MYRSKGPCTSWDRDSVNEKEQQKETLDKNRISKHDAIDDDGFDDIVCNKI